MKVFIIIVLVASSLICKAQEEHDSVLNALLEGNKRFYTEMAIHPHMNQSAIKSTSRGQKPFALVLACSDSRVIPESIFDVGIGDLFVIRLAGNIVENGVLGSIEYAVNHLGIKHIIVLGHTQCGAVKATVEMGSENGKVSWLVNKIKPAYHISHKQKGDVYLNTIMNNVCFGVKEISVDDKNFKDRITYKIIGALYHVETGVVELLNCK